MDVITDATPTGADCRLSRPSQSLLLACLLSLVLLYSFGERPLEPRAEPAPRKGRRSFSCGVQFRSSSGSGRGLKHHALGLRRRREKKERLVLRRRSCIMAQHEHATSLTLLTVPSVCSGLGTGRKLATTSALKARPDRSKEIVGPLHRSEAFQTVHLIAKDSGTRYASISGMCCSSFSGFLHELPELGWGREIPY